MPVKLDLGKAWETAMALLKANKDVVLIVAGVFFFLPSAISEVVLPENTELNAIAESGAQPDPEVIVDLILGFFQQYWWMFAFVILASVIGTLSLLALLRNSNRPTVGEAIGVGFKGLIPYIGVAIIGLALVLALTALPAALGGAIHPGLAALFSLLGLVVSIYLNVKFSLTSAVIAIEGTMNPVRALSRSWQLTKGNSFRLFAFYLLLIVVLIVLSLLFSLFLSIFAIFGDQIGLFTAAIFGSLFGMLTTCVMVAVQASVHRQLSGGPSENVTETFE